LLAEIDARPERPEDKPRRQWFYELRNGNFYSSSEPMRTGQEAGQEGAVEAEAPRLSKRATACRCPLTRLGPRSPRPQSPRPWLRRRSSLNPRSAGPDVFARSNRDRGRVWDMSVSLADYEFRTNEGDNHEHARDRRRPLGEGARPPGRARRCRHLRVVHGRVGCVNSIECAETATLARGADFTHPQATPSPGIVAAMRHCRAAWSMRR
jgi:hypothetical protein